MLIWLFGERADFSFVGSLTSESFFALCNFPWRGKQGSRHGSGRRRHVMEHSATTGMEARSMTNNERRNIRKIRNISPA
jgi:hypothetical protein